MLIHVKPMVNIRYQCHKTTADDGYLNSIAFTLTFVSDQYNQIAFWGSKYAYICLVFTKLVPMHIFHVFQNLGRYYS